MKMWTILLITAGIMTGCATVNYRPNGLKRNCNFVVTANKSYYLGNTDSLEVVGHVPQKGYRIMSKLMPQIWPPLGGGDSTELVLGERTEIIGLNSDAVWLQIKGQCGE
jgi:hypothetical protein